jgi:hypothetical protein
MPNLLNLTHRTSNFPASWENTGDFAYFASWDQSKSQNIPKITMCYERIPDALEQGSFAFHQGIELGNHSFSGKELSWRSVGIVLMKSLGNQSDTQPIGGDL